MRSNLIRYTVVFLCLLFGLHANGQNATINIKIENPGGYKNSDNVTYGVVGAKLTVGLKIDGENVDDFTLLINKTEVPGHEYVFPQRGTYNIQAKATIDKKEIYSNSTDVTIYDGISVSYDGDWGNNSVEKVIWNDVSCQLKLPTQKDALCQVSYIWHVNGKDKSDDSGNWTSQAKDLLTDGNDIVKNISCTIQYLTPDKSAVLKEWTTNNYTYHIFRKPEPKDFKIQAIVADEDKPVDNAYYLYQNSKEKDNITLFVSNQNNYNGLSYSWRINDNEPLTTSEVTHSPFTGLINEEQHTDNYKLTLTYCPDDGLEAFKCEYIFDIVTYPDPTVSIIYQIEGKDPHELDQDRLVIWDDTEITFPINTIGGNKDGWTYSWTVDGKKYNDMSSYADGFKIGKENSKDIQISLHVENIAPDTRVLEDWDWGFVVVSWKKPDLASSKIIRNVGGKSDNEDVIYLYVDYDPVVYGERSFEIRDLGYEKNLWKFLWTDGELISSDKKFIPIPSENADSRDVSVEVSYEPEGLLVDGFSKQYNVQVRTFGEPEFVVEEWKTDQFFSVWEDTQISLHVKTNGGYTESWTYDWETGNGTSNEYSTLLNKFDIDSLFTDHRIVLAINNEDPDGVSWYNGTAYADYRSYRIPQFDQITKDTIKLYQYDDTLISILQVIDNLKGDYPQNKWSDLEINATNVADKSSIGILDDTIVVFIPGMSEPVLGLHDTLSVNYNLFARFRPDNVMAESLYREYTIPFITKYWPGPQFVVHASDDSRIDEGAPLSVRDGDDFKAWIEVSDCIDGDNNWQYIWDVRDDENVINVTEDKSYDDTFNNDGENYKDIIINVTVNNELSHRNKNYEECKQFRVRINPQFNTIDGEILLLPSKEMNEHYFYETSSVTTNNGSFIYYTMDGFEGIKFPIEHSNNKIINECEIYETIGGNTVLLNNDRYHLSVNKDTIVVSQPNVKDILTMHESVNVKYKFSYELEDTLRDTILKGTFNPACEFRIYNKPKIGQSGDWNQDVIYVVWDDTPITTTTVTESKSTDNWKYEWSRKNDDGSYAKVGSLDDYATVVLQLNDEKHESIVELQLVATCYAPGDNNIKWYEETLSWQFAVWKKPERKVYQFQNVNETLKQIKSENDTLNVCVLYSDIQDISLSFNALYSDNNIMWTDTVYWGDLLKKCYEEIDRNKASYEYARYTFDRFDYISESFVDSIRYVSQAIPQYADEKYEVLCDTVFYEGTLFTRIWPIQKYKLDNKDDFWWNNDSIIIKVDATYKEVNPLSTMNFTTFGGLETSRGSDYVKYYWSKDKDGDYIEYNKEEIEPIINNKKEYIDATYYVKCVQSGFDGLNWCKDSIKTYNVRCYPVINVPAAIDGLDDEVQDLIEGDIVKFSRPYDDYDNIGGTWTYRDNLYLDGTLLSKYEESVFEYQIESNDKYNNDSLLLKSVVECTVENGFKLIVNDSVYTKYIKVWPLDKVSLPHEFVNNVTIIHKGMEKETKLYCKHEIDKIDKYWNYEWSYKCDDDSDILVNINNDTITAVSDRKINDGFVDVIYHLNAKYKPGNAKERDYSLSYNIREYSEPLEPSIRKNGINQYREGDSYDIKFNNEDWKRSGNQNGWIIEWNRKKIIDDGKTFTSAATEALGALRTEDSITYQTILPDINKDKQYYEGYQYSVTLRNFHPDNTTEWKTIELSDTVYVYNRPPEPSALKMKGNGTSGIYIAMFSDGKTPTGVEYEFGQEDIIHTSDPFTKFAPDSPQIPWVRTYWEYSNDKIKDYVCFSDTVFYVPVKNGTKAAIGELNVDYMHFAASLENPDVATVRIMDSSGQVVQIIRYDADTDFDEYIDLDEFKSGMYLIRVEVGGLVETKKTLIR